MQILVLSDIHSRIKNLEEIISSIHDKTVDLILITGDLTNYGEEKQTNEILDKLNGFEILAIPGNMDTRQALQTLEKKKISLHGKKKKIGKWTFVGQGGGLTGDPGELMNTEKEIEKTLDKLLDKKEKTILLTHLPPKNTKIDLSHGILHIGSKAVRKIIEKKQPKLHLCGHVHEALGEDKIGQTTSINPGAVKEGKALLLTLGKEITWKRIQL